MASAWRRVVPSLSARVKTWLPWRPQHQWEPLKTGLKSHAASAMHMAEGADGTLFVSVARAHAVVVFDANGTYVDRWGSMGQAPGLLRNPWGIAVVPESAGCRAGQVVVVDAQNHRVQVFKPNGTVVSWWGAHGCANGYFQFPQGVAITCGPGPSGATEVVVTERFNHRVQVFRLADGTFLRQWGSKGRGAGQFDDPAAVCVTQAGEVLVSDYNNHRIQVFRLLDGACLRQFGMRGCDPGELEYPWGVTVHKDSIVIADSNHRVQVFRWADAVFIHAITCYGQPNGLVLTKSGCLVTGYRSVFTYLNCSRMQ